MARPARPYLRAFGLAAACLMTAALHLSACSSKAPPKSTAASKRAAVPMATKGSDGAWSIAPTGSKFEPPIQIAAVPDQAWYCDMGTVHYAQSQAGDKTCKLCKMKLKHKSDEAKAPKAAHPGNDHDAAAHHGH